MQSMAAVWISPPSHFCTARLNTDVLFGKRFGMKTLAVLTGITSQHMLDTATPEETPDYYTESIADAVKARAVK